MRIATLVLGVGVGVGVAALTLSGCSKSDTATHETTTSKRTVTQTFKTSTTAVAGLPSLPKPPTGASRLESSGVSGVQHARYSVTGQTPRQVVDYYVGIWTGQGYTITDSSGGGDGGSGARAAGSKAGTFVSVDAGAGNGEPTYFDVCAGGDKDTVEHCGDHHD